MNLIQEELQVIDNAVNTFKLKSIFALFSGGHDSLCSTFITSQHPLFKGVIHIDTGIGIPATQQYVKDVCNQFNWPLKIYKALEFTKKDGTIDPQNYDEFVKKWGFPGAAHHKIMYSRLKERPLNQAYRELKIEYKPLAWSTGIRLLESKRRSRLHGTSREYGFDKHKSRVWINPIRLWDENKKHEIINFYSLPKNPVYEYLCKSGECLCGAFAQKGELLELEIHCPVIFTRLQKLYQETKDNHPWHWDEQPPKNFFKSKNRLDNSQFLCHSCNAIYEQAIQLELNFDDEYHS